MRNVTNRIQETRIQCPVCKLDAAMTEIDGVETEMNAKLEIWLRKQTKCDHEFEVLL